MKKKDKISFRVRYLGSVTSISLKAILALVMMLNTTVLYGETQTGQLELSIVDSESGGAVPARVEVLDSNGNSYFAEDALLVGGMCGQGEEKKDGRWGPIDYQGSTLEDALTMFTKTIKDRFSQKEHFYSTGKSTLTLPSGSYSIRVFKGPEYEVSQAEIKVVAGKNLQKSISVSRFTNMPEKGWYSADDHLHITRYHKGVDPVVLKLMIAEDIHVGNLLQMGRSDTNMTTYQYAHGKKSRYQEGNHLITSGQENMRTHLLGHTITLGADEAIYNPETYPLYKLAWKEAVDQGALNGFAHFGEVRLGLESGLPILAPHNLMHFLEVLQFNRGRFGAWYNLLNLGFRIAPTAGTDYMCNNVFPGAERFFTKVEGPFNFENWLEGVRAGRTFVTTGPILEFGINDQDIGGEVFLSEEAEVTIKGEVKFQKRDYDYVMELELVENGEVIKKFPRVDDSGKISFEIKHKVQETSWLALRINSRFFNRYPGKMPYETAHSAPIYVTLENSPPIAEHPRTRAIAKKWLASLEALETKLLKSNIQYLHESEDARFYGDPLPAQLLMDNYSALMDEIEHAKAYFQRYL